MLLHPISMPQHPTCNHSENLYDDKGNMKNDNTQEKKQFFFARVTLVLDK